MARPAEVGFVKDIVPLQRRVTALEQGGGGGGTPTSLDGGAASSTYVDTIDGGSA